MGRADSGISGRAARQYERELSEERYREGDERNEDCVLNRSARGQKNHDIFPALRSSTTYGLLKRREWTPKAAQGGTDLYSDGVIGGAAQHAACDSSLADVSTDRAF